MVKVKTAFCILCVCYPLFTSQRSLSWDTRLWPLLKGTTRTGWFSNTLYNMHGSGSLSLKPSPCIVSTIFSKIVLLLEPIHKLPSAKFNSLLCQHLCLSLHHTLLGSSYKSHAPDFHSERHCQCLPLSCSNFQ